MESYRELVELAKANGLWVSMKCYFGTTTFGNTRSPAAVTENVTVEVHQDYKRLGPQSLRGHSYRASTMEEAVRKAITGIKARVERDIK